MIARIPFIEALREHFGYLTAIPYIRQSWEEKDSDSAEKQDYATTLFGKNHRMNLLPAVVDLDIGGGSFDKRKVSGIISRVRAGEANVVLVLNRSRWGRSNQNDAFEKELNDAGGVLISVTNPLDPNTSQGRTGVEVDDFVARIYRKQVGDHWRDAHTSRRKRGLPHAGGIRFGYMACITCTKDEFTTEAGRTRRRYIKCEACRAAGGRPQVLDFVTSNAAWEFMSRWVNGESARSLAIEMEKRGIRSVQGKPMSTLNWFAMLDTGFTAGYIRSRKIPVGTKGMPKLYTGNKISSYDVWERGAHAHMIEEELWEKYKAKRAQQHAIDERKKAERRKKEELTIVREATAADDVREGSVKHPLVGILRCGMPKLTEDGNPVIKQTGEPVLCMAPMYRGYSTNTKLKSGGTETYRCGDSRDGRCKGVTVTMAKAHKETVKWLVKNARGEDVARRELIRLTAQNRKKSQAAEKKKEVQRLTEQLRRLTADRAAGIVSDFAYKVTAPDLESKLLAAQTMHDQYMAEAKSNQGAPKPAQFQLLADGWERFSVPRKRMLLKVVLSHIVAHKTPGTAPTRLEFVPRVAA